MENRVQKKKPVLEELQEMVGGYIQQVPYFTRYGNFERGEAWANEYGKVLSPPLPLNEQATKVWWKENLDRFGKPYRLDELRGDIVFITKQKEEAKK
jgi:hypothetical protein